MQSWALNAAQLEASQPGTSEFLLGATQPEALEPATIPTSRLTLLYKDS